ncbi:hypothetical protein BT96DRAFT_279269 [Gymnopus androsaceus JB14]|uniref:Uncharacterized protein n=1 Tax=Gymnopus androsaceus JB14 TaxID=1447944 RepID=A0A6A4IB90_9AGAR|nr:hypothetical protein BT96DRAFT_279269 [Gymnopus androsaceus JB14]
MDKTVRIWDATAVAQMSGPLEGHDYSVQLFSFPPDGARIASGSFNETLRIQGDSSILSSTSAYHHQMSQACNNWHLSSDGWITFPNSHNGIIWIPSQFRRLLWRPQNTCIISRKGYTELSFEDCVYGDEWFHCVED